ncbi:MAG: SEC-C domain-containing protein [Desulfobacteraceae bacterium]|nr:SEC-C domain-containing protein [Desulfobacteraceae bacterium]
MEENRSPSERGSYNPLQPVFELLQGGDPDRICLKYGIARTQLDKMLTEYQESRRQAALADSFTLSRTGRNDPCPCGSGKKYKKCCLPRHEEARSSMPPDQLQAMEARAREKEKLEKEVQRGFEMIFSLEFDRAVQYAKKQLQTYPEDDRFHDILQITLMAMGDYGAAFGIARTRWQVSLEEKLFFQENGYHKREGVEKNEHVHFYSPSTWLEKFWIAQRARTWSEEYPVQPGSELLKEAEKLRGANDLKRFTGKKEEGLEERRQAFAPVLARLASEGAGAIPCILPLTYNFTWASLFVPDLLHACGTNECIRLLAELSMFRYPYFSQQCLSLLEKTGERALQVIGTVLAENPAFDELKAGLLTVMGNIPCENSFKILAAFTEHENRYLAAWACEALGKHKNPDALPCLEKARERLGALNKIAGAIKEIAESTKR